MKEKIKEIFLNLFHYLLNEFLLLDEKNQIIILISIGIFLTIITLLIAVKIDEFIYYHTK